MDFILEFIIGGTIECWIRFAEWICKGKTIKKAQRIR